MTDPRNRSDPLLRRVAIVEVPGRLLLCSMPGRGAPLDTFLAAARADAVTTVVCLVPWPELRSSSPEYAAFVHGAPPWAFRHHPIDDFGEPDDEGAFAALVHEVAEELRAGRAVVVHCAAGIGRTGTFATCVLCALGVSPETARRRVEAAGSRAETPGQRALSERLFAKTA